MGDGLRERVLSRVRADARATACVLAAIALASVGLALSGHARALAVPEKLPEFVARPADFHHYRSWPHFTLDGGGQYARTIYYKRAPGQGSRFGVGSMIVKELQSPRAPGGVEIDAMVKRGGSFGMQPQDAPGWEWFGLSSKKRGEIVWRGVRPPASGGGYGGSAGATCAGCHAAARENDYVQSPPLRLHPR